MQPKIEIIDSEANWHGLAPALLALCEQTKAPVFVDPDWLDAAWAWRGPRTGWYLALAGDGSRATGFAAMARTAETLAGVPTRTLHFVTVPDTQFTDLVCEPPDAPALSRALAETLVARRHGWDRLQLHYLTDRYGNWRHVQGALAQAGIAAAVEPTGINPYVELGGRFDDYYAGRSRSLKKAVNLSGNRLARLGEVRVDWVRDPQTAGDALAEAIRVSAISWKQDTGNSLDQPGPRAFIERLTPAAARRGWLSLWLLRIDGRVIATEYQLIAGGDVHALRSDFDPAFADASPGTYLNHHLLAQLFDRGLGRYYMGPGSNAYKLRWTDVGEPMFRLTAYSPTARGRLLRWLEQSARPLARRWRQRLQRAPGKAAEAQR